MNVKQFIRVLVTVTAILLTASYAVAQGNGGGHGNGGGGGGGGSSAAYAITPFTPPGSTASFVSDINDHGQAVGVSGIANGGQQAIHFDIASGQYTTLPDGTDAQGINNLNQIVGWDGTSGIFWSSPSAASPFNLPPLPNDLTTWVEGINDAGIVIGASKTIVDGETLEVAVVWHVVVNTDGTVDVDSPVELPPLQAGYSRAMDINEVVDGTAQVVGESGGEAVIWTVELNVDGVITVPNLPTPVGTSVWSIGNGVNNFGDVCGQSDSFPFVAPAGQEPQLLPVPSRGLWASWASDINDDGKIVGCVRVEEKRTGLPREYAYLWKDGQRIDLASEIPSGSGWDRLSWATVINNDGLIGGYGRIDVQYRGFILIPNAP